MVGRAGTAGPRALLLAALLGAGGCSVADNLTYAEIAGELDRIVQVRGSGPGRTLEYADRAAVSTWYMRWPIFVPVRGVLGFVAGDTAVVDLENPSGHVRELIRELPDEVGSDLAAGADAVARLLLIAELDQSPANRIVALDAATRVLLQLGIRGVGDPALAGLASTETARLEAARAGVQLSRPSARSAATWNAQQRSAYRASIEVLVERPLADWSDRIALIGDLLALWQAETEGELRPFAENALRTAVAHAARGALIRALRGRDAGLADARMCAIQQFRRLGGPDSVPFLLALMAEPASGAMTFADRFDRDPLVQLRLIHLCGQLRGEAALRVVQLPGRESWDAISPADFLAQTVLTERAYYSKLRVPALTALSLCLGKDRFDYGIEWVEEWYRERQRT